MSSPSITREFRENKQEVCFSDDATWMSHRNDRNSLRSAGNRNELGVFSFAYFSLDKQRKVRPAAGRRKANLVKKLIPNGRFLFRLLASIFSLLRQRKDTKRKATRIVPISCAFDTNFPPMLGELIRDKNWCHIFTNSKYNYFVITEI